ncbi:MAG: hypothetical protein IJB21_02895 [Bacilli bacterium]|nr:hypothetical protein [Bacilli bacterium]
MITTINTLAFVYQDVEKIGIVFYTLLFAVLVCTMVAQFFVFKKYDYLSLVQLLLLIAVLFLGNDKKVLFYVIVILSAIIIALRLCQLTYHYLCGNTIKQKVEEHLKNDTIDFFITMDKKNRIINSSASFAQMTKLTKKEILKKNGWYLMFEALDVVKINDEEFITSNKELFIAHLDEVLSKYKMYEFTLDLKLEEHDLPTHYNGYIQAIYFKDKKIGTAVYLYSDRQSLISGIKGKLDLAINNLYNHKNVLHILMSLSEGVALYYDYQERLFFATQSFQEFVGLEKESYTFKEVYEMIVDEDRELYNEQSGTINSISPTRIKIRLNINNVCFNAIEDALFLTREGEEYISIIHITSRCDEATNNRILSSKESAEILSGLSESSIAPVVYKVEELLNESLKDDIDEE